MKLSKDERYTAYCIMMAEIELNFLEYESLGFCYLVNTLFSESPLDNFIEYLSELYTKKTTDDAFWFPSFGWLTDINKESWQKRIEILKQCINETHP